MTVLPVFWYASSAMTSPTDKDATVSTLRALALATKRSVNASLVANRKELATVSARSNTRSAVCFGFVTTGTATLACRRGIVALVNEDEGCPPACLNPSASIRNIGHADGDGSVWLTLGLVPSI